MLARRVLVGIGGQQRSVVRITPPLNISKEELQAIEDSAAESFAEVGQ